MFDDDILSWILTPFVIFALWFCIQPIWYVGSKINVGHGQYTGIVTETHRHGFIFKTNGFQIKTGLNSDIYNYFCVLDKHLMNQLKELKPNAQIKVHYDDHFTTPSWQCDALADSSQIVTRFEILP